MSFFETADNQIKLYHSRRELLTPTLKDNSVNLILEDYPYCRVKKAEWDNQWKTPADYLAWMDTTLAESERILAPNGSLYVFASPQMSARVECLVGERFNVLNRITWRKTSNSTAFRNHKEALRCYIPNSECIIFAEHKNTTKRGYGEMIQQFREKAGMSCKELTGRIGAHGKVNHGGAVSNWEAYRNTPSRQQWGRLCAIFPELPNFDAAIRPFNANPNVPYTDVWDFRTVTPGGNRHICEKPEALIRHIIEMSSREGDLVFDGFSGSFTTLKCAWDLGRRGVGCDMLLENCVKGAARFNQRALI